MNMETEDYIKELERRIELKKQLIMLTIEEIADIRESIEHHKREESFTRSLKWCEEVAGE